MDCQTVYNLHIPFSGQCPSLYTHKELAQVAATLAPSQQLSAVSSDTSILMKKKSAHDGSVTEAKESAQEKLDKTLELFFSNILSNLHVVVMAHVPVLEGYLGFLILC